MSVASLLTETKVAFINSKLAGNLDVIKVIELAVVLASKIQKIATLSGADKKAVLVYLLKYGLDLVDGMCGFEKNERGLYELQLLSAFADEINASLIYAHPYIPVKWYECLCLSSVETIIPADQKIIHDALVFNRMLCKKDQTPDPMDIYFIDKPVIHIIKTNLKKLL